MAQRMMACLAVAALAGVVSCTDSPLAPATVPALTVAPATDSVLLTYICGNMFRVRNMAFEPREVRWNIHNASPADTGSLWLRGRDVGATHVDYFVTARTRGTMRVFVGGVLRQTKANGNRAACAAPVDTTPLPTIPAKWNGLPNEPRAQTRDGALVARTVLGVMFDTLATSPAAFRSMLRAHNAQIVRVIEAGFYYLRLPDPGTDAAILDSLEARAKQYPFIMRAAFIILESETRQTGARFPSDGLGLSRSDYLSNAVLSWPARTMRLPQAWWCETGLSTASGSPRIATIESNFPEIIPADLAGNVEVVQLPLDTTGGLSAAKVDSVRRHGTAVAGIVAARGDNATGTAGVMWRAALTVYSLNQQGVKTSLTLDKFEKDFVPALIAKSPRILTLSSDFTIPDTVTPDRRHLFRRGFYVAGVELMTALPNLMLVKSADNFGYSGNFSALDERRLPALLDLAIGLKSDPRFADRVIIVGSTNVSGRRSAFSNDLRGLVDLYAPGEGVPVLTPAGSVAVESGTSFSTPMVAGIAAQLLAMDPSLSARDVKLLLLAGARDSVEGADGVNVAPSPVSGISDVVYEADAYGSLRLLSARAGTPLCGAQFVRWADPAQVDQPFYGIGTRAIRYGGTISDTYPEFTASSQSLAPGGRALAFAPFLERQLQNRTWRPSVRLANGERRIFGERDTLSYRLVSGPADAAGAEPSELRLRLSRGDRTWKLKAELNLTNPTRFGQPSMSPDGRRVLVPLMDAVSLTARLQIAVLDTGSVTTLLPDTPGAEPRGLFAWSPDSRRVVHFLYGSAPPDGHHIRPVIITFGSGAPVVTGLSIEPRRFPVMVRWSDEGNRLSYLDVRIDSAGFSDCRRRDFAVTATGLTLIHTTSLDMQAFCADIDDDSPDSDYAKTIFGDANSGGPGGGSGGGGSGGGGGGGVSLSMKRQALTANRDLPLRSRLRLTPPGSSRARQ